MDDQFLWRDEIHHTAYDNLKPPFDLNELYLPLRQHKSFEIYRHSAWQQLLPNVDDLTLVVTLLHAFKDHSLGNSCQPARCLDLKEGHSTTNAQGTASTLCNREDNLRKFFEDTRTLLKPSTVQVVVKGFGCEGYDKYIVKADITCKHGCSEKVAKIIDKALELGTRVDHFIPTSSAESTGSDEVKNTNLRSYVPSMSVAGPRRSARLSALSRALSRATTGTHSQPP